MKIWEFLFQISRRDQSIDMKYIVACEWGFKDHWDVLWGKSIGYHVISCKENMLFSCEMPINSGNNEDVNQQSWEY